MSCFTHHLKEAVLDSRVYAKEKEREKKEPKA